MNKYVSVLVQLYYTSCYNACMYIVLDCQRLPLIRNGNHVIRTCKLIYEMCVCVCVCAREREREIYIYSLLPSMNISYEHYKNYSVILPISKLLKRSTSTAVQFFGRDLNNQ